MLKVEALETRYGQSQVLFGIEFEVRRGEVVTLLGRNGMGKTTTVRSIMGMTPPFAGRITFEDNELRGLPPYRIARRGLGLVPEGRQIFSDLTVMENLTATAAPGRSGRGGARWTVDSVAQLFWMGKLPGAEPRRLVLSLAICLRLTSTLFTLSTAKAGPPP